VLRCRFNVAAICRRNKSKCQMLFEESVFYRNASHCRGNTYISASKYSSAKVARNCRPVRRGTARIRRLSWLSSREKVHFMVFTHRTIRSDAREPSSEKSPSRRRLGSSLSLFKAMLLVLLAFLNPLSEETQSSLPLLLLLALLRRMLPRARDTLPIKLGGEGANGGGTGIQEGTCARSQRRDSRSNGERES